jgi:virginiamycin B lyase
VRTHEFTEYVIPEIPPLPPDAALNPHWEEMLKMDRSELPGRYGLYGIGIDSHDNIWVTTSELGNVIQFNPKTKKWKFYPIPGGQHMKDVKADADDNIWFSSHNGHRLGKIVPSTGEIKLYQMPTPYASTYGIVMDKKRGYLWTPDFSGGQITRFNLKTEEFTEYRFPTPHGLSRFIGLDPKGRVVFTESNAGVFGILDPGDL